ncbi:unnamed protein product [Aspergillus oryzae var. brunneus]|uniref:Unnamed protein product n=1 Tax=Aspergillus oryzae var. brunneus TaxID=332754 RepID=A0ABQ6KZR8_ASPOZ|nr:unnamed protein product [Aspergillus oryzae]GMG49815.1 unnamed protein product [Aspergillus oryzae var. brunneus]
MGSISEFPRIKEIRTFIIDGVGSGGDYHNVKGGHWLIDSDISTPMTKWAQYRGSRTSWGINVLGSFCVEIEATDGTKGFATGFGGPPACWLPASAKAMGFIGAKVALPHGPDEGTEGLLKNVAYLRKQRESVGPNFPLRVDCYMSLNVPYTIQLVKKCEAEGIDIDWWEECLSPDDFDGHALLKKAHPTVKFTTGEHEYSRYGFRKLVEGRNLDIIQPDVMWVGGLTELLKVSALAAAYDIPVVPHASGPYSYHYVVSQPNTPFQEYLANSADGHTVEPVFGNLFLNEPIPTKGYLDVSILDKPGFGLELNPAAPLIPASALLTPAPQKSLPPPTDNENGANGAAH